MKRSKLFLAAEVVSIALNNSMNVFAEEYIKTIPLDISGYSTKYGGNENEKDWVELPESKAITGSAVTKHSVESDGNYEFPYSAIVCLNVYFDDREGDIYNAAEYASVEDKENISENSMNFGTGILIGPDTILTCAHIMYPEVTKEYSVKDKNNYYRYKRKANIKQLNIAANLDMESSSSNIIEVNATEIFISQEYEDIINKVEGMVVNGDYSYIDNDSRNLRKKFNCDFAIIKIDTKLGDTQGWVGLSDVGKNGSYHGIIAGFPTIVPELPNVEQLKNALVADKEIDKSAEKYPQFPGKAIRIKYMDEDTRNKTGRYKDLLETIDSYVIYSGRRPISYERDHLLKYGISTYSGESGAPILIQKWNNDKGEAEYFTYGIHLGYLYDKDYDMMEDRAKIGEGLVFICDTWGNIIDMNDEHSEDELKNNKWRSSIELLGYNRGKEMDAQLYNCIIDKGWSDGKPNNPNK